MTKLDQYKKSFIESLSIKIDQINKDLKYNSIPEWDSIGHMTLISSLEETFGITLETDDIIDFSSFEKGKQILKKYKINL